MLELAEQVQCISMYIGRLGVAVGGCIQPGLQQRLGALLVQLAAAGALLLHLGEVAPPRAVDDDQLLRLSQRLVQLLPLTAAAGARVQRGDGKGDWDLYPCPRCIAISSDELLVPERLGFLYSASSNLSWKVGWQCS